MRNPNRKPKPRRAAVVAIPYVKGGGRARYVALLIRRAATCPRHQTLLGWVDNPPRLLVASRGAQTAQRNVGRTGLR